MNVFEAALATQGSVVGGSATFVGVSTDSRTIGRGELFVALAGANFDGHEYLSLAEQRGAAAAMVRADRPGVDTSTTLPLVVVEDTRRALGDLAAYWRRQFDLPLIGITGSNGKTTCKEMMRSICAVQAGFDGFDPDVAVLATEGNLNNDIGLPLTLLKLNDKHRFAIIEAGMNHPGEIAYLAGIAQPTVALVVNAMRAHLEGMGSLTSVAKEKGSLFEYLVEDGVAVMNADSEFVHQWRRQIGDYQMTSFSLEGNGDVNGEFCLETNGSHLKISAPGGSFAVYLQVPGRHNVQNALAAAAATLAAGCSLAAVQGGLNAFCSVKGRLQRKAGLNGARLYDDTYNANPDSVRAAIDVLAFQPGRRILILGDMAETGEGAEAYHREIGEYAKQRGIDELHALGCMSELAARSFGGGVSHAGWEALANALIPSLDADTTVLIKGSRFMKMERVVALLLEKVSDESVTKEAIKCC